MSSTLQGQHVNIEDTKKLVTSNFNLCESDLFNLFCGIADTNYYENLLYHFPYCGDQLAIKCDPYQADSLGIIKVIQFDPSKPNAIYVKAEIGGLKTNCLVDSGASTSFISESFFLKLTKQSSPLASTKKPREVMMGNAETTLVNEAVVIPVSINGAVFKVNSLILDNLPFDIVLGINFLKHYGALMNRKHFN